MKKIFRKFSTRMSQIMGSPYAFVVAIIVVLIWWFAGPAFDYSDTWQLLINTGTTIFTFLMVILIQNTQNRDTKAIQIKLDELVRAEKGARNLLVNVEDVDDVELDTLQGEFKELREAYERKLLKIQEVRRRKRSAKSA